MTKIKLIIIVTICLLQLISSQTIFDSNDKCFISKTLPKMIPYAAENEFNNSFDGINTIYDIEFDIIFTKNFNSEEDYFSIAVKGDSVNVNARYNDSYLDSNNILKCKKYNNDGTLQSTDISFIYDVNIWWLAFNPGTQDDTLKFLFLGYQADDERLKCSFNDFLHVKATGIGNIEIKTCYGKIGNLPSEDIKCDYFSIMVNKNIQGSITLNATEKDYEISFSPNVANYNSNPALYSNCKLEIFLPSLYVDYWAPKDFNKDYYSLVNSNSEVITNQDSDVSYFKLEWFKKL